MKEKNRWFFLKAYSLHFSLTPLNIISSNESLYHPEVSPYCHYQVTLKIVRACGPNHQTKLVPSFTHCHLLSLSFLFGGFPLSWVASRMLCVLQNRRDIPVIWTRIHVPRIFLVDTWRLRESRNYSIIHFFTFLKEQNHSPESIHRVNVI